MISCILTSYPSLTVAAAVVGNAGVLRTYCVCGGRRGGSAWVLCVVVRECLGGEEQHFKLHMSQIKFSFLLELFKCLSIAFWPSVFPTRVSSRPYGCFCVHGRSFPLWLLLRYLYVFDFWYFDCGLSRCGFLVFILWRLP